jgi:hypothetical protein
LNNEGKLPPRVDKELNKEKALALSCHGFFIVDKEFEISDLDLIKDMNSIINVEGVLSLG